MVYTLEVVRPGWTKQTSINTFSSGCTISLLRGPNNIIVDPGSPWDSEYILSELNKRHLNPSDINYVVCSHEHVDHIGSLYLFPNAVRVVGLSLENAGCEFCSKQLETPFAIDSNVKIIHTPGHTTEDISLIVNLAPPLGLTAITGDLFECQDDVHDPALWKSTSCNVKVQDFNRNKILALVDHIVPGHGNLFQVK